MKNSTSLACNERENKKKSTEPLIFRINSKSKEENRLKVLIKSMQLQVNTYYIDLIGNGSFYQACLQMQHKSVFI